MKQPQFGKWWDGLLSYSQVIICSNQKTNKHFMEPLSFFLSSLLNKFNLFIIPAAKNKNSKEITNNKSCSY